MKKTIITLIGILTLVLFTVGCTTARSGGQGAAVDLTNPEAAATEVRIAPDYKQVEIESPVAPAALDPVPAPTAVPAPQYIGLEAAKEIALSHVGLSENDVVFTETKEGRDNGEVVYDIEFFANEVEYDFEIDAISGTIREFDYDMTDDHSSGNGSNNAPAPTTAPASTEYIGLEAAKKIALSHANVSASEATFTKAKQDRDDGRVVYELEFFVGNVEYEYEIDAISGRILDYDREIDDD